MNGRFAADALRVSALALLVVAILFPTYLRSCVICWAAGILNDAIVSAWRNRRQRQREV